MKALLTLALVATSLTLSNCTSDGRCIFAGKKKACAVGCTKPCCATKAAASKACCN